MRNSIAAIILYLCASLLLNISNTARAEEMAANDPVERNFIFYVDNSGSMSLEFPDTGMPKMEVAMNLLEQINSELPDVDANVGVYTYGPHREYHRVSPYDRDELADAFEQIPTDFKFAGRITSMACGIQNLDPTIEALPGRVDFVVVTDGVNNAGNPPDEVIADVYQRYGDRVCFHFISFIESSDQRDFVKKLSQLNDCSLSVEVSELSDANVRANFIEKVFAP